MSIRVPPFTTALGLACAHCFEGQGDGSNLSRCGACKRVSYCSPNCQKNDWKRHKALCKAFKALEEDTMASIVLNASLTPTGMAETDPLNNMSETFVQNSCQLIGRKMGRPLNMFERNAVAWQPRCLACTRSDIQIKLEQSASERELKRCPDCKVSFCCSDAHWDVVRALHSETACPDGHDGLTQCQLNQELLVDEKFANIMAGAPSQGPFEWAPERVIEEQIPLQNTSWEKEFGELISKAFSLEEMGGPIRRVAPSFLRSATNALSLPMSILWGLQQLSPEGEWRTKEELTIHILGPAQIEVEHGRIFEEILHRLPGLKKLNLVFCGPEVDSSTPAQVIDMETCKICQRQGRKRLHHFHKQTYHDFVRKQGSQYAKPDLAIAYNSGMSDEAKSEWIKTLKVLVERKVPSLFTSYNSEEASAEARMIQDAGGTLVEGPIRNPWGSILMKLEPSKVYGFYSVNGWIAGAFN